MDNQEIEKKLQESADKIEMRDFEEVWREIGPKIEAEEAKRRRRKKIFIPVAASLFSVAVACSVILPIDLRDNNPNEEIFYLDEEL